LPAIEPIDRLVRSVNLHPDDQPPASSGGDPRVETDPPH
jgi:hypothetical protein